MTFEELGVAPEILKAIHEMGFEHPMPVQEKVIPLMLGRKNDIIALAQTGTGKTAAYGLPLIQEADTFSKTPQSLILCPTRELCLQITGDLNDYARYSGGIKVLAVYGGSSISAQISELRKGVQIIVATPGRMTDLIERKAVRLSAISRVVLDEADEMLNMGFLESINGILAAIPEGRNTLLFSATMPDGIRAISRNYMHNTEEVTIGVKNSGAENVRHICYTVHAKDKYFVLKRIADFNPGIYGIVFCRTRRETQEIADKLIEDGYNADSLHGDLSQSQRDSVMQKVRARNIKLLVATDVAARGLDVDDLTHVINYGLPDDHEVYTHRSGRTGRAGKMGTSIVIANLREKGMIRQIEHKIKKTFQHAAVPKGREICEKQLFHLIDRMEKVESVDTGIESYLPAIYKRLAWLDKEEIIRRFLSLEFNRFLDYYRDAAEIGEPSDAAGQGKKSRRDRDRSSYGSYVKMRINFGRSDGMNPGDLIGLINAYTPGKKVGIGRIELQKDCSFFEVEESFASQLRGMLKGAGFDGRKVIITPAGEGSSSGEQRKGKKRDEGYSRRSGGHVDENSHRRASAGNREKKPKKKKKNQY